MKNVADTEAFNIYDHFFSGTIRTLSRMVGLKRLTQPFWKRWLASGVDEQAIFEFLDSVGTIDNWATTASQIVDRKIGEFEARSRIASTGKAHHVKELRELSYLCYMAQWGCMPMNEERRRPYRQSRDFYLEAERLAYEDRFLRVDVLWQNRVLHGNLHIQYDASPLVVLVYGIDGCKEEHLATELALHGAGFSTFCFDGPGQGEALILDGIQWQSEFPAAISAALDAASAAAKRAFTAVGVIGISIGGTWVYQCAAKDERINAVYDLGAPIHTRKFGAMPFLIKTRMCQVTGARTPAAIEEALRHNNIESVEFLKSLKPHIRMLHGSKDRVVDLSDKEWQLQKMGGPSELVSGREMSLRVVDGGDHCCTNNAELVRADIIAYFKRTLVAQS